MENHKTKHTTISNLAKNSTIVPLMYYGGGVLGFSFFKADTYARFYVTKCEIANRRNTNMYLRLAIATKNVLRKLSRKGFGEEKPFYLVTAVMNGPDNALTERTFVVRKGDKVFEDKFGKAHALPVGEWVRASEEATQSGRKIIDRTPYSFECTGPYLMEIAQVFPFVNQASRLERDSEELGVVKKKLSDENTAVKRGFKPIYFKWLHKPTR